MNLKVKTRKVKGNLKVNKPPGQGEPQGQQTTRSWLNSRSTNPKIKINLKVNKPQGQGEPNGGKQVKHYKLNKIKRYYYKFYI